MLLMLCTASSNLPMNERFRNQSKTVLRRLSGSRVEPVVCVRMSPKVAPLILETRYRDGRKDRLPL